MNRKGLLLGAATVLVSLTACNTINIYDAWMSPDGDGSRKRTVFLTDSTDINAIAKYSSGRTDATLTASIFPITIDPYYTTNTSEPAVVPIADLEEVSSVGSQQILDVQLSKGSPPAGSTYATEEPWLPGTYRVDFQVDGVTQRSTSFAVEFHDCPTVFPNNLTPCYPLYRKTAAVAANGDGSFAGCDYSAQFSMQPGSFVCTCADWSPVDPVSMQAQQQPDPSDPTKTIPVIDSIWVCNGASAGYVAAN